MLFYLWYWFITQDHMDLQYVLPLVFWKMQWWYSSELSQRSPQYNDSKTLQRLQSPEQVVKTVTFRLHSVPPVKSESLRVETVSTWFQSVAQFRNCSLRRRRCRAGRWGFPARFSTAPTVLTSWTSRGILVPDHYFPHWKQWSINKRKSFQQSLPPKRNILNYL